MPPTWDASCERLYRVCAAQRDRVMRVELANPEQMILCEIADPEFTRDSVALTYAFCIRQRDQANIQIINRAIMERWSESALEYIKCKAWKRIEGKAA